MRTLILLFAFIFAQFLHADGTVRFSNNDTVTVTAGLTSSGSTFSVNSIDPSGDGTSRSAAGKTYIPVSDSTSAQHVLISDNSIVPTEANGRFFVSLEVTNNTGGNLNLYAAADDDNDDTFLVVGGPTVIGNGTTNSNVTLEVRFSNLCQADGIDCDDLFDGVNVNDTKEVDLYFFMTPDTYTVGSGSADISSANNDGGVFLEVGLSDDIIDDSTSSVTINNIKRGDSSLIVNYTGPTLSDINSIYALIRTGASDGGTTGNPVQTVYPASTLSDLRVTSNEGEAFLRNLTNSTTYFVRVVFENRYKFATRISNEDSGTPLEIEEILENEACYILSAGFQESHFVVNYFKGFRDYILSKFSLGRSFIRFYYKTAPEYASYIYQSPILSFIVRVGAYCLFFMMNLSLLAGGLMAIIHLRKFSYRL